MILAAEADPILGEILARMPERDAAYLMAYMRDRLASPSERRAARLDQRDALVREALAAYGGWCQNRQAEALARELRRAAACPHAIGERANLLRDIIRLSGGRAIGVTQIANIANGSRSGVSQ